MREQLGAPASRGQMGAPALASASVTPRISAGMVARSHGMGEPRWAPVPGALAWCDAFSARVDLVLGRLDGSVPPAVLSADHPLTPIGAYGGGAFVWAGDHEVVAAGADGLLRVLSPLAPPRALTRDGRAAAPVMSPDGSRVAFVLERDDTCDIAVVPVDGSAWPQRVSTGADYTWDPAWSPDGRSLAWHEWDLPNMPWDGSRIVLTDLDAGTSRAIGGGDKEAVGQPRFSPSGDALAYVTDRSGWVNVWIAKPDGSRARAVLPEPHEQAEPGWGPGQRSFAFSPDGNRLVFQRNEGGFGRLVSAASAGTSGRSAHSAHEVSKGWHRGLDWTAAGILCVRSGARTPPAITVMESDGSNRREIARGAVAGFDGDLLVEPEDVTWPGVSKATVHGLLWRPRGADGELLVRPPLLVHVHGGPTSQALADWMPRVHYFVDRGWAVLAPNGRGSTGYGRGYAQALAGQWGEREVDDVVTGIRHAVRKRWSHAERIAILGGSAGGFTALLVCARENVVRAGVSLYGVTDLFDLAETTHRFESRYLDHIVGALPQDAIRYRERSPVTRAGDISVPVLVLQGADDKVVPPAQAERLVAALRRAGTPVEHHVYEGEGHGWTRPETVQDDLERTDAFLTRWVLHR
jgi:dipeptidyl aminopeptidase/acylaminoacyl peptidase